MGRRSRGEIRTVVLKQAETKIKISQSHGVKNEASAEYYERNGDKRSFDWSIVSCQSLIDEVVSGYFTGFLGKRFIIRQEIN